MYKRECWLMTGLPSGYQKYWNHPLGIMSVCTKLNDHLTVALKTSCTKWRDRPIIVRPCIPLEMMWFHKRLLVVLACFTCRIWIICVLYQAIKMTSLRSTPSVWAGWKVWDMKWLVCTSPHPRCCSLLHTISHVSILAISSLWPASPAESLWLPQTKQILQSPW